MTRFLEQDKTRLELRGRMLQEIEQQETEASQVAEIVSTAIVRRHLATMECLNVRYDLLPRESEILHLRFWEKAFALLKERGAIYLETEGKNKGCWVMRQSEAAAAVAESERTPAEESKVIVRSNGVVTYVGKDIAYQFWKLGLLGRDFHYRVFEPRPDGPLWATTTTGGLADHPLFGGAAYVYNVIDVRQSYLQKLLKQALIAVGHPEGAERSHHFSYEMVALSHATARELGYAPPPDSEDAKRPFVEVSGRKGLGVKADDLLDTVHDPSSFAAVKPKLLARARKQAELAAHHPNQGMSQLSPTAAVQWQNAANRHAHSLSRATEAVPEVATFFVNDLAPILSSE